MRRRSFLKKSTIGLAAFSVIPRHVLGGNGYLSPSDQLTFAVIGVGGMGRGHMRFDYAKLRAVCDVDKNHLERALELAGDDVAGYHDYREVLAREDIDVIHVVTPPHWHALIAIAAARAGKDIWCEKPMTRTIGEGVKLVEEIRQSGCMFRLNTWFRFRSDFYGFGTPVQPIKKIVQNGLLGWPLKVTVSKATGFDWKFIWNGKTDLQPEWIPEELDYDMWLGPAPFKPYHSHRVHGTFRGYWDYDGGGLGDMGQHYLDPVQYILGKDDTGPVKIEAETPQAHPEACGRWDYIRLTYADGCEIVLDGAGRDPSAAYIEGPEGKLYPALRSNIKGLQEKLTALPDPAPQLTDFAQCVRNRQKFALNETNGHRSATLVNLGKIAVRLGRTLHFDPVNQKFINDEAANRLIDQPMRMPWHL